MTDPAVEALILDLLEWLADGERTYQEVMDVWRTSCPRLPVWEDANDRGFITSQRVNGRTIITASSLGLTVLDRSRPRQTAGASRAAQIKDPS